VADPFGRGGSSRGGGSDPFGRGGGDKKSGGGLIGELEKGAHYVAKKAELAGHDVKSIPGGIIDLGKGLATHPIRTAEQVGKSTLQTIEHPLRDPFMTALTLGGLVSGVGSIAGRAAAVGDMLAEGGDAGMLLKAAAKTPAAKIRLLESGDGKVALHPSKNPAVRAIQGGYDKVLQKALDTNPEGRIAGHAQKRIGGAQDETMRYQARMREAPAAALDQAAKKLSRVTKPGEGRLHQAALELTSVNTTPEKAAAYHLGQAAKGVDKLRNATVARLYQTVADRKLLTTNEHGDVVVNAADHPKLAEADLALARTQGRGDEILSRYGIRSPEALQAAKDAPGRYRAGATYEKPTPGKQGISPALIKATAERDRIEALHQKALDREAAWKQKQPQRIAATGSRTGGPSLALDNPYRERINNLGSALEVANERVATLEKQAAARVKPTGVIGGETARPGRGHISYASSTRRQPGSPAAASPGPVVGVAKTPITSHANTGFNIEHGKVPENVTAGASRHFKAITRFVNTTERRNAAIRTGSDTRRSARDVLVKVPGEEHAKLTHAISEALGKEKPTIDEIHGLNAALEAFREDMVPGLGDHFAADAQHPVGTSAEDAAAAQGLAAPHGYKWVDRNALGDLAKPAAGPRGRVARMADNVNSAVTAATVYFKIGHVGTRVFTDAATNIIQGSAKPLEIAKSLDLWKQLDHEDRVRALAAAGQHGFDAMPHEGTSATSKVATKGASWWAKHVDAPFRFNSIAYEARKAGFNTPEKFREMLDRLERPHDFNMNAAQQAKVDYVAKRANREGIAYDRLSNAEKRFIARAVWFYPWIRGTAGFAFNTVTEHPFKSAILGAAGSEGRQAQQKELGDLPDYEAGLFKLAGGSRPLVADFSTFSPFATPADLADALARPGELSGFLNPVYGAGNMLVNGENQFGSKSQHPLTDALASLLATTPEAQVATAALHRKQDQSKRMFRTTPASAALRTLFGPGTPRRINLTAAHSAAARQRSGR
jgi:hypothetical protein